MRYIAGIYAIMLVLLPFDLFAADIGVDAMSLFRLEERNAPAVDSRRIAPATQYFTVNLGKLADGNLSLHIHGWGRIDLADQSRNGGNTDGNVTYGYLSYRLPQGDGQLKAGRFFVYDLGHVEQVDGAGARVDLLHGFVLSGFAGKPVGPGGPTDNRGDFLYGGRLGYRYGGFLELGIAALHEQGTESRQYVAALNDLRNEKNFHELIAGDIWIAPNGIADYSGRIFYDPGVRELAEQNHFVTIRPRTDLSLAFEYNQQRLEGFFAVTALPSTVFRPAPGTEVVSYSAVASYTATSRIEVSADAKQTKYDAAERGKSRKFGLNIDVSFLDGKIRTGGGLHRVDSQVPRVTSYNEVHGYGLYTASRYFGSADIITHLFDEAIYGKTSSVTGTITTGYRVTPELALSGDISYGWSPQLVNDLRGLLKLTYHYESSKGAR
ncbi:hypothetical protein [Geobacter sp. DSM 9736]|uniref:hypothetical protein n=1 Tax=Geobacter sp. DSM 9736 TaxID=1277350 RepID=UPI000B510C0C|nr:hypothetical protein [Geobacter sp. DSM 9736]SNB46169.1 hypothetical protein SAMN06269301_1613 [Geobacter sp. DSM 9736]